MDLYPPQWMLHRLLDKRQVSDVGYSDPHKVRVNSQDFWVRTCRIRFRNPDRCESVGAGIDSNLKRASLKAFMEAVERASLPAGETPASAAGLNLASTTERAYLELIERDAYLRWALELTVNLSGEQNGVLWIKPLISQDSKVFVRMAALKQSRCVMFGLGAARTPTESASKAIRELGLSIYRHQLRECSEDRTVYGELHRETNSVEFRERLFSGSPKEVQFTEIKKIEFSKITLRGPFHWPMLALQVSSTYCLDWNLEKMKRGPLGWPEHIRNQFEKTQIYAKKVPTG